ncbi:unnamed protein product [Ectocarpus fasciculatus]
MERICRNGSNVEESNDDEDAKHVAFLRARVVEAAREGDTPEIKYLMGITAAKRLLAATDESSRWSLLHFSCSRGFLDITTMLLEAGAKALKAVDRHGKTCLHLAIEHDCRDVIELLLDWHPVCDWPRRAKLTLGQTAARAGGLAAMQLLLRNGLDPNDKGIRRETPLHQAARHGHAEVIELLLRHGADVTAREAWAGRTPLHYACQAGSLKAATALIIKGGADPHIPDLSAARHTPLEAAVVSGYRALSHRLVILVDSRQRADEKRQAILEGFDVASREAVRRETKLVRHAVSSLRGRVVGKRSLVRLEKQQLTETLRGQLSRAKTRLRNLQSQHERLHIREEKRNPVTAVIPAASVADCRPSTCPTLSATGGLRGDSRTTRRPRLPPGSAGRTLSRHGVLGNRDVVPGILKSPPGERSVRLAWGTGYV